MNIERYDIIMSIGIIKLNISHVILNVQYINDSS